MKILELYIYFLIICLTILLLGIILLFQGRSDRSEICYINRKKDKTNCEITKNINYNKCIDQETELLSWSTELTISGSVSSTILIIFLLLFYFKGMFSEIFNYKIF